jgi:hypothetical protein
MKLRLPPRIGRPGLAAALALILAAVLALGLTPHWETEARAEQRARAARVRAAAAPPSRAAAAEPALPPAAEPAERVARLLALAPQHGLAIARSQQRLLRDGPVLQIQLGLSAQGRYGDLRAYIADALAADPALALDRLQWHRAAPGTDRLEAELQWAVLQGSAPKPET